MNEPVHVNEGSYEKIVTQSKIPVIVDFWAPWCGPCKNIAPILETIADQKAGQLLVAKVNVDENSNLPSKYGIQSIPTILFIFQGKIAFEQIGFVDETRMTQLVDQFLEVAKDSQEESD